MHFFHIFVLKFALLLHQHILVLLLFLEVFDCFLRPVELGHHLSVSLPPGNFLSFLPVAHDVELILPLLLKIRPHFVHAVVQLPQPFLLGVFIPLKLLNQVTRVFFSFLNNRPKLLFNIVIPLLHPMHFLFFVDGSKAAPVHQPLLVLLQLAGHFFMDAPVPLHLYFLLGFGSIVLFFLHVFYFFMEFFVPQFLYSLFLQLIFFLEFSDLVEALFKIVLFVSFFRQSYLLNTVQEFPELLYLLLSVLLLHFFGLLLLFYEFLLKVHPFALVVVVQH